MTLATDAAARSGVRLSIDVSPHTFRHSIDVSPHTFRHSFAMHMLYHHVPPKVLQSLLGHEKSESTEVYTKLFALDVAAGHQVHFSIDTAGALQLLRANV